MNLDNYGTFTKRYGKVFCGLLFILIGAFTTSHNSATGQTLPTVVVKKIVEPVTNDTPNFTFHTSKSLNPQSFTLQGGASIQLSPSAGPIYTVTEIVPAGWVLTDASCDNGSNPMKGILLQSAPRFTRVTCTFTNRNPALDLTLKISDKDVSAQPGQMLVYTLAYANGGSYSAEGVFLSEQVPEHTVFVGTNGWQCTPNAQAGAFCLYPLGTVAAGASGQVEFAVQVNAGVPAGVTELRNEAMIGAISLQKADDDTEKTPLNAAPDLTLRKSAAGAALPGGVLIYTITYKNQGNQGATGVFLTETVPEHSRFDSDTSSSGWNCTGASCRLVVGALAAGAEATVNFGVKVTTPLPAGVVELVNRATIADDDANGADPTPGNNAATTTTPVNRTFLMSAAKRASLVVDDDNDGVPSPGDTLEYEVTIRNQSPVGVQNLIFSDIPDANTTLLTGVQSSQGVVIVGNGVGNGAGESAGDAHVEVALGELAGNGATATIRFRVRIKAALPLAVTAVQNQGIVSSSDFGEVKTDDPTTSEAGDATRTPLRAFAQLKATLIDYLFVDSDGNEVASVGDTLIYRLTLENIGNSAAGGIQVTVGANAGLTLRSGSVSTNIGMIGHGNGAGDATLRVDIALLPPGDSALISYQMRITEGAQGTVQTQAVIAVQSGLTNGPGQLLSDDPDVSGEADVTVTVLGSTLSRLQTNFLPLIAK